MDYNKHMGKMLLMCFGLAGFVLCLWACGQGGKIEEYSAKQSFKDPENLSRATEYRSARNSQSRFRAAFLVAVGW